MLVRRWPAAVSRRDAKRTWSTISATSRSRPNPSSPVAQNGQPDGAAGLARDAQRVAFARSRPRRVVHQHRFDERAVGQPVERLLGQAAVGFLELGVGDGVEAERGVQLGAQAGRQRQHLVDRADRAAPHAIGDLAGAVGGDLPLGQPRGQGVGGQPGQSRAFVRGHRSMLPQRGQTVGRTSLPTIAGRPRRYSTHGMRRPPAGWTSWSSSVPSPVARPRATEAPGRQVLARPPDSTSRPSAARGGSRRRSPARAGRREPGGRARRRAATRSRRPSSRRSGRVSVAPTVGCGCSRSSPRSHGSSEADEQVGAHRRQPRLQVRRGLVRADGRPCLGDDRTRVEALVHPHQGDARRAVAGQDRRRDRRRAAVAREHRRMEVERAVPDARAGPAGRSGRSRRGR